MGMLTSLLLGWATSTSAFVVPAVGSFCGDCGNKQV